VGLNASDDEWPNAAEFFGAASSGTAGANTSSSAFVALSDWTSGDTCPEGHRGDLCAHCEDGLAMWGNECTVCGGGNNAGIAGALVVCVGLLLLVFAFQVPGHASTFKTIVDLTQLTFFVLDPWSSLRRTLELTVVSISSLSVVSPCPGELTPTASSISSYLVYGSLVGAVAVVWAIWYSLLGGGCCVAGSGKLSLSSISAKV